MPSGHDVGTAQSCAGGPTPLALAYAHLAPSLAFLIHTQRFMFYDATSFNGDVSSWNVSSGTSFVSACDPDMYCIAQWSLPLPRSLQEDILL